jgi:tricorn protease-like protein
MMPHQYVISPDGEWLAGPLKDGNTTNLYKISTADGRLVRVTDFGSRRTMIARQVSWSPDGAFLYAAVMEVDADVVLLEGALHETR